MLICIGVAGNLRLPCSDFASVDSSMVCESLTGLGVIFNFVCFAPVASSCWCAALGDTHSSNVSLHIRSAHEVTAPESAYARVYEAEVVDVLWNLDESLELWEGALVQIRTPCASTDCDQSLQPDAEYLLYAQHILVSGTVHVEAAEFRSTEGKNRGDWPRLEALHCSCSCRGNIQPSLSGNSVPVRKNAGRAFHQSECTPVGGEGDGGESCVSEFEPVGMRTFSVASSFEDLSGIISALCIVLMCVLRLAAF